MLCPGRSPLSQGLHGQYDRPLISSKGNSKYLQKTLITNETCLPLKRHSAGPFFKSILAEIHFTIYKKIPLRQVWLNSTRPHYGTRSAESRSVLICLNLKFPTSSAESDLPEYQNTCDRENSSKVAEASSASGALQYEQRRGRPK